VGIKLYEKEITPAQRLIYNQHFVVLGFPRHLFTWQFETKLPYLLLFITRLLPNLPNPTLPTPLMLRNEQMN
jgi:hypothetical protein